MPDPKDTRLTDVRLRHGPEQVVELIEGRQDMDYGAIIGLVGLGATIFGALVSLFDPVGGIFVLGGLIALVVGVVRYIKGVIRVRSTRGIP